MHKGLKKDRIICIHSLRVCDFAMTMFPLTSLSIRIPLNPIKFISVFHYLKNRKPSVTHLVQTVKTIAVSRPFSISLYWFGTQTQTPNSCESIFFSNQFTVTIKAFYQSLIFMFIKGALFFAIS